MRKPRRIACSRCGAVPERFDQHYCNACHAAYMREYRKRVPLTEDQKAKDICRSYAGVYKRRGVLVPEPCQSCGADRAEMHHPDYGDPMRVEWLCRACHLATHREAAA